MVWDDLNKGGETKSKTQRDKRPRPHFYADGLMLWSGWCSKQPRADLTTFGNETKREE
ncbi:hypothetical protein COLO4_37374 [Corchorus olitorius]|uniref:Uncharacterized protein n=1 Tax=Corchorus olitorius TaxID=93759 RepID=A0A1R3G252_9ROSI|nr:hypothetical protein COLO4_37374 [Corchorus olitorius]